MSDSAPSQRPAAILAADAAGYSRPMSIDDKATVAALDAARAVFRAQIEAQQRRGVDMAGRAVSGLCWRRCSATDAPSPRHRLRAMS